MAIRRPVALARHRPDHHRRLSLQVKPTVNTRFRALGAGTQSETITVYAALGVRFKSRNVRGGRFRQTVTLFGPRTPRLTAKRLHLYLIKKGTKVARLAASPRFARQARPLHGNRDAALPAPTLQDDRDRLLPRVQARPLGQDLRSTRLAARVSCGWSRRTRSPRSRRASAGRAGRGRASTRPGGPSRRPRRGRGRPPPSRWRR